MTAFDVAQGIAGIHDYDPPWQLTMMAIAFAESGGDPNALGDFVGQPGESLPDDAVDHAWLTNGPSGRRLYTSVGLWQDNMAWNWDIVTAASGSEDPAQVGEWLTIPHNNGIVALAIYERLGFGAWATFNSGAYLAYTGQAQAAFNAYPGSQGGITIVPGQGTPGPTLGAGLLGAGQVASGLGSSDDWSGSVRVSSSSVANMAATAVGYGQAFRQLAQGS